MPSEEQVFEAEVLRVARALFGKSNPFQGSQNVHGRERDGIFESPDAVVLIECTVSGRKDKAVSDGLKLAKLCEQYGRTHPLKLIKGYFVTKDEPSSEQRGAIQRLKAPVVACSLKQLRAQLIDSQEYISLRPNYAFGSARHPVTGKLNPDEQYVSLEFAEIESSRLWSARDIVHGLNDGRCIVLTGDYGAGKSMTVREVFRDLARKHHRGEFKFPIALNLRDHQGQRDPEEALDRHAKKIGFGSGSQLVRAWLAGDAHLLLDGFDEIATPGWLGKANGWKDVRRLSTTLVRKFIEYTPAGSGVFITGRTHFFDSIAEARSSLGLPTDASMLSTSDFNDEQIKLYLTRNQWGEQLPSWLPSRPLLLGYLVVSGLLKEALDVSGASSAALGWNVLLDKICEREARNSDQPLIDGPTIRLLIERLATMARARLDGMGPLSPSDMTAAFESVTGGSPDEGSQQILQRLPGLGVQDESDGSRHFIDAALADAARAGDIVRGVSDYQGNREALRLRGTATVMEQLGVDVATRKLQESGVKASQAGAAAALLQRDGASDALLLDVIQVGMALGEFKTQAQLAVSDLLIPQLTIGPETDLSEITFSDCIIQLLDLTDYDGEIPMPSFARCSFGLVEGLASASALPSDRFSDCDFEQFDLATRTTQGILGMVSLNPSQRVALTILKKLYAQRGTGRRENALYRGLDDKHRGLVPSVLDSLVSSGLAVRAKQLSNKIVLPSRGQGVRVKRLLEAPTQSQESFFIEL
ncbi:NACHT domain-containing protein [Micromonospora sp. NPDC049580]|uniref:NACHT domain-containing protein n=1 Tax=Micromonospora sp. NPDC049580 TaxID=3154832 RepID=UPI003415F336